ncbi:MAG: nuclear transport factor 2 family protein [Micropepsaceae bacterium]
MEPAAFRTLLDRMGDAASAGDADAFAACFTPDGVYHDYVYGPFAGRANIAHMLTDHFHAACCDYDWRFFDAAVTGDTGYARSLSRFVSTMEAFEGREVVIDGFSRFRLQDGLIAEYWESVNAGVAHVQLGVDPARSAKVFARWARELRDRPDAAAYAEGVRARYAKS